MTCAAFVPLHSRSRYLFSFSGDSWCVFDVARCEFFFLEWVSPTGDLFTKTEIQVRNQHDFEEVLRLKHAVESFREDCLRAIAVGYGVPYELITRPVGGIYGKSIDS